MKRVVVTGIGLVCSIGDSFPRVWDSLLAGKNGVAPISFFDSSHYPFKVSAEVRKIPQPERAASSLPREHCRRGTQLFHCAAFEAYSDAGIESSGLAKHEIGVAVGCSVNYVDLDMLPEYFRLRKGRSIDVERFLREGVHDEASFSRRSGDAMAATTAEALGVFGPNLSADTACAASAHSIGEAFRMIRRGEAVAMIAGGAGAFAKPLGLLAFELLGALSHNPDPDTASRPFDAQRDGFVMGEAGGAIILEDLDHARRRGAEVYAEIAGYGTSTNAHNLTDPSPGGVAEERAMRLALRDAGMQPESVDYIAAHGTSTPKNDVSETTAIKNLLGDHSTRVRVSSNKGQIGHTISAAGVCNVAFTAKALQSGQVPPTMHLTNPDPQCDLDYVPNASVRATVRGALCNAFAFGGQNAVIALKGFDGVGPTQT